MSPIGGGEEDAVEDSIVVRACGTFGGRDFKSVEAVVRPDVVGPGSHLRMIEPAPAPPVLLCAFHTREERDAFLDALEERLFDLNHPVRPPTP